METRTIIQTTNLTRRYNHLPAVDNLNFEVKEGEIFGFLGPNGAGKTTTLLMLLGLSRPSEGSSKVCGLDSLRKAKEVKRLAGYLPENIGFYGDLDAVQNLEYVADLNGMGRADTSKKIEELLELVGLKQDAYKKSGRVLPRDETTLGVCRTPHQRSRGPIP